MALTRDYDVPGTGLTVTGAYFVISRIELVKRTADIPDPTGSAVRDDSNRVDWAAGYIGQLTIDVYASSAARLAGNIPIGSDGSRPEQYQFMLDIFSSTGIMEQAYTYLKTLPYYAAATDA